MERLFEIYTLNNNGFLLTWYYNVVNDTVFILKGNIELK